MTYHIVFLCNEYPPAPGGGIGTFYMTLARRLVDYGWKVTVGGVYAGQTQTTVEDDHGVNVWRLPASPTGRGRYRLNMLLDRYRLGQWVKRVNKNSPIDLVEAPDYQGWLWAVPQQFVRVVRIHFSDAIGLPLLNREPTKIKGFFEIASFRKADHVVSTSHYMTSIAKQRLGDRIPIKKMLYNAVDVDQFCPNDQILRQVNTVASVATLTRKKGVFQLLEAWRTIRKCSQAQLYFYGRDSFDENQSTMARLKTLTKQYGLEESVNFVGTVPYEDLVDVFRKSGVIVFPSYMEAHPRAWLEALATGAPVVASSRGPGPEVVFDGKTGLLADPDNVSELAEKILQVLHEPKLGVNLGLAARADMLERFSFGVLFPKNVEFYRNVIQSSYAPNL